MNLGSAKKQSPEVNLTPLIDVVFLLIIFFMVSTTFDRDSQLMIDLPEASVEPVEVTEEPIEITIDAQGRFYVDGKQLVNTQLKSIKRALLEAAGERAEPTLVISADAQTPHQAVVSILDAARQLGFFHLTFATQLSSEDNQ